MARKTTTSVRLRPLRQSDLDALLAWRNDPLLRDLMIAYPMPVSVPMEQAWLDHAMRPGDHEAHFAIELPPARLIGIVSLRAIDWVARKARFGMMIGDAAQRGRGHGRAVLEQVLAFAFHTLNLARVHLEVADYNTAAVQLYRAAGFTHEGTLRAHVVRDGAPCDVMVFGLLRAEWEARGAVTTPRRRRSP